MDNIPADKTSSNNKREALEYTARASETENNVNSLRQSISDADICIPRAF